MPGLETTRDLRQQNRATVFRRFVVVGRATRAELAAHTGLSIATVNALVNELMAEGFVADAQLLPSAGGRPVTQLAVQPDSAYVLGADIGERGVTVVLFNLALERLDQERREGSTRVSSADEIAKAIDQAIVAIRDRHADIEPRIVGLGMALPGIVQGVDDDMRVGDHTLLDAQNLGWQAVAVRDLARAAADLPLYADNGAKALATAEMTTGAASGHSDALIALLGGGVGLGIVVNGRLVRGTQSSAGEWGHTKVASPFDASAPACSCGARGCLEAYIGEDGMVRRWRELRSDAPGQGWEAAEQLLNQAQTGHSEARAVLLESLAVIGRSLGNLVNLTNPEVIVLGGRVGLRLVRDWQAELNDHIRAASLIRPGAQYSLTAARLGDDAIAMGAALLALNAFINNRRPNGEVHQARRGAAASLHNQPRRSTP